MTQPDRRDERLADERLREILAAAEKATPGPWLYRPWKYDDWGVVRSPEPIHPSSDPVGPVIANARAGRYPDDDELSRHRAAGTDPYGANATHIANCDPSTIAALASELLALREALAAAIEECAKLCEAEAALRRAQGKAADQGDTSWGIDTHAAAMAQYHKAVTADALAGSIRALAEDPANVR